MQLLTNERQVRKTSDLELTSIKTELEESNLQRIAVQGRLEQFEQDFFQLESKSKEMEQELNSKIEELRMQVKQSEAQVIVIVFKIRLEFITQKIQGIYFVVHSKMQNTVIQLLF